MLQVFCFTSYLCSKHLVVLKTHFVSVFPPFFDLLLFVKAERRRQKEELRREKEEARLKAASERATTRRLARESMELIEDDRLELMELAASSKGLPSIVSLDHDTMQNLEAFRGGCCLTYSHDNFSPLYNLGVILQLLHRRCTVAKNQALT